VDPLPDPDVEEANHRIVANEEKTQAMLAYLHKNVQHDVDRINAKLNRPGEPGVVPSSLMQIDDPDIDDTSQLSDGTSTDSMSDADVLKSSFEFMHKDREEMRALDKTAKEELHAFRRGDKEAKKLLNHVEMIRDLRHKRHVWRENRVAARARAGQPSSFLEEKAKKDIPEDDSDRMLKQFMAKMTAQKQEYDEERKQAEAETTKARAEIASAQKRAFASLPSSLAQTKSFPEIERSDNLGDVEKTLGQLQGRMRDQLNHFASVGRKDQLEEDMELKRMNRVFPGSFAEATEEKRPHIHHHHRAGHRHHSHVPHSAHHRHSRPSLRDAAELDSAGFAAAPTRASALVQSVQKPILDDSKLNADLAAFSDATKELGKEENQMKTDAAKFAADMDAATVNAGSFLQVKDRSEEGDRPPTSLVQMGETTALGEWRKHMDERKREIQMRHNTALRTDSLSDLHVSSLLQTP